MLDAYLDYFNGFIIILRHFQIRKIPIRIFHISIWYNIDMETAIEIALASDRNYFRGLAVTACSIAKSAAVEAKLRFHLLHIGLTEEDQKWLANRIRDFHAESEVVFHDVSCFDMSKFPAYASSRMAYARLFLPDLLPDCRYVIYSDVDILWQDDIADFWAIRGSVGLVGCVRELSARTVAQEQRWFEAHGLEFDGSRYFCTGISFYNLDEIRRRDAFKDVLEFGMRYSDFNCPDQAMMYATIGKEVLLLPDRWQQLARLGVAGRGQRMVLHYAGEAPWRISRTTKMLTDAQLLWFDMCAEVFGETKWRSLRKFYKTWEIIVYRAIFLIIFRIPPIHALFRAWLRRTGRGPFEESFHAG